MRSDAEAGTREYGFVDLTKRRLFRVFNNSSFEEGGRLYGGWWQNVPDEYRRYITINGKHTVELDYSGIHVALLYEEVHTQLVGDAYDVGVPQIPRDYVKRTFNKLLNAQGRIEHRDFREDLYGISWNAFVQLIKERHAPIAGFLGTGYGIRLQKRDADIATRVVLRFTKQGYACLPIHDSFIVHYGLQDELQHAMDQEMEQAIGRAISIKLKPTYRNEYAANLQPYARTIDQEAVDEAIGTTGPYKGYFTRQAEWYRIQT